MDPASQFRKAAATFGERVAVAVDGRELSYREVYERACRLANALRCAGVAAGDPVAILTENRVEVVEQAAGCALGNFPRATLYTYHSAETNAYLVERIGAKALIVDEKAYAALLPHLGGLAGLRAVVVMGQAENTDDARSYDAFLAEASSEDVHVRVEGGDVHIIRFSSGTTGRPKGIFHTIATWQEFNSEYRWATPLTDEQTAYLSLGSYAHFGVALLWSVLPVGGKVVLMKSFEPGAALDVIEQQQVTHVTCVPVMLKAMVEEFARAPRGLTSLRCVLYAGSPIGERTLLQAVNAFGPVLYQVYAQSEVLLMTTLPPHLHSLENEVSRRRLRSVGRATPNVRVTIRGDDGSILPAGAVGEIAALSPGGMDGIWGDQAATDARVLADGSILTRDMGYLDKDGFLYLVDRKDDMIISGGYNIWPSEIEAVLAEHPGIADVCVVGVPHERWGETPKAFVVLRKDQHTTETELIALTRERLGGVKKVTAVEFVSELPKSGTGKIQRDQLKARHWTGRERRVGET